jgi:hypothetical protein
MVRQVVKSCMPALVARWKGEDVDHFQDLFFLGWWPLLFSLQWRGLIRYGVSGS